VVLKPGKQNNAKDAPKRYQTAMKPNEETNSPKKKQEKQVPRKPYNNQGDTFTNACALDEFGGALAGIRTRDRSGDSRAY
jgi:hypothetical protein